MKISLKSLFFAVLFFIGISSVFADFQDLSANHLNKEAVIYLEGQKIIQGYPDGNFMPDTTINRAEFVKIIIASLYKSPYGANCFSDVKEDWYAKYVCFAKMKGLIKGYKDGTFKPTQNINLAEASKIIVKAFNLQAQSLAAGDPWYKPYLKPLESKNVIPVSIDYVDKKLTRGEMSEIIWRLKANKSDKPAKTYENLISEFPKLSSCAELKEKFLANKYKTERFMLFRTQETGLMQTMTPMALEGVGAEKGGGGGGYSQTNVQVEGVDEADIIKNDDKYIYLMKEKTIRIIKAYPAEEMQEVFKLALDADDPNFWPIEMYVSGNKLAVIGNTYSTGNPQTGEGYKSKTKIYIYDITDRQNVSLTRALEFDGNYLSSRKINNHMYMVMSDYPNYNILEQENFNVESLVPQMRDSKYNRTVPAAPCNEIHFYPRFTTLNYLIVAGVSLNDETQSVSREVFMGSGSTIYASPNNLYVAATKYGFDEQIKYEIWNPPVTEASTLLYRFNLNQGNVEYKGQGEVQGTLLNQFSMDEYNNTFRVATTKGSQWGGGNPLTNNLYILDASDLTKILGRIENIAQGEKIYSARFIGDRAYLVTFKKIDPFFVIDVSNPSDPKILGALKIPGYSDYLHPFDENHIIGFGKQTIEPQEALEMSNLGPGFDFAWYQGIKIALFDVTDVSNPKLLFNEIIGDRGTESELLWNHKALLFDKVRNLFAFPITVALIKDKTSEYTGSQYGEPVFEGAYVYTLNLQNGFQLKAKITHFEGEITLTPDLNLYILQEAAKIKRIIYIGDYLYTISPGKIKAIERSTMEEKKALEIAE